MGSQSDTAPGTANANHQWVLVVRVGSSVSPRGTTMSMPRLTTAWIRKVNCS
ncbi:hypothetical protein EV653_4272 [Kribbella pratensis]|uniref:Uncharacterized protein n=1 Tax=Kribbella pratensis TaxID=2512112 RepID=A0A4R8C3B4_9ACTN|nr:hypothetical protein EV653_4272 [Kribbella pratensis]